MADRPLNADATAIEALLVAQSKVLALIIAELDAAGLADRLWPRLEMRETFQDGEEDPGVVPGEAFGLEAAVAAEIRRIAEEASMHVRPRG